MNSFTRNLSKQAAAHLYCLTCHYIIHKSCASIKMDCTLMISGDTKDSPSHCLCYLHPSIPTSQICLLKYCSFFTQWNSNFSMMSSPVPQLEETSSSSELVQLQTMYHFLPQQLFMCVIYPSCQPRGFYSGRSVTQQKSIYFSSRASVSIPIIYT